MKRTVKTLSPRKIQVLLALLVLSLAAMIFSGVLKHQKPKQEPLATNLKPLSAKAEQFHHITFKNIKPTKYSISKGQLTAITDKSASAFILPFKKKRTVNYMSFEWKFTGNFNQPSVKEIKTKGGDDAILRLGLMVSGRARLVPFFAPTWIKKTADIMKFPAGDLIYLNPHSPLADNRKWKSPYSTSIQNIAVGSKLLADKWRRSTYKFDEELTVVGLWIMSDGDNTSSKFETHLRNLVIR